MAPIKESVIIIKRGESGYWSSDLTTSDNYTVVQEMNDIITPQTKYISTDRIAVIDQELNIKLGYVAEIDLKTRKVKQLKDGIITEYPNLVRFELF